MPWKLCLSDRHSIFISDYISEKYTMHIIRMILAQLYTHKYKCVLFLGFSSFMSLHQYKLTKEYRNQLCKAPRSANRQILHCKIFSMAKFLNHTVSSIFEKSFQYSSIVPGS